MVKGSGDDDNSGSVRDSILTPLNDDDVKKRITGLAKESVSFHRQMTMSLRKEAKCVHDETCNSTGGESICLVHVLQLSGRISRQLCFRTPCSVDTYGKLFDLQGRM